MASRDRKNCAKYSSCQQFHCILFHMNFKYDRFLLDISNGCFTFSQNPVTNPLQVTYADIPHSNQPNRIAFIRFPSYSIIYSFLFVHNSRLSRIQVLQISFTINILDSPQNCTSINLIQQVLRDFVLWGASHLEHFAEYHSDNKIKKGRSSFTKGKEILAKFFSEY